MGMTFGDGGFSLKPIKHKRQQTENESPKDLRSKGQQLEVIYETDHPFQNMRSSINSIRTGQIESNSNFHSDFKENILLSFYNWPKVETSAVKQESPLDFPDPSKQAANHFSKVKKSRAKVNKRCSLEDLSLFTVNEDQLSHNSNLDYSD